MPFGYRSSDSARALRYRLTLLLHDSGRPWTVAELADALRGAGVPLPTGRTSKLVSDSLRWEVGRGRVVRLGRGQYGPGRLGRGTAPWMRAQLVTWDAAFEPRPQVRERVSDNDGRAAEIERLVADTLANLATISTCPDSTSGRTWAETPWDPRSAGQPGQDLATASDASQSSRSWIECWPHPSR